MKQWLKYGMVVIMVLAMVVPASLACGGGGAAKPGDTIRDYMDAYTASDAAAMIKCETATIGGLTAAQRKDSYQAVFDTMTEFHVTNVTVKMVSKTDTTAIYKVEYAVSMKIADVTAGQSKEYDIALKKDGGWLITSAHLADLFT